MGDTPGTSRIVHVSFDASIGRAPRGIEHDRAVAIYDLLEENFFRCVDRPDGPYRLVLSVVDRRLVFDLRTADDQPLVVHVLSLTPFRKLVKDYFLLCDSYYQAIRSGSPSRIEAIDMGRRGLHDEGSRILQERLADKIEMDFATARRLFTLIAVLSWRGQALG
jgi:uncharacterized protein (UPF0262 family)